MSNLSQIPNQNQPLVSLSPVQQYWMSESVQFELSKTVGARSKVLANNIVQIINENPQLKDADAASIMGAALTAASLDFQINKTLGFAYIVPFQTSSKRLDQFGKPVLGNNGKAIWDKFVSAQLQIGYRGFIQLAQRTGKFKIIDACVVYQGDTDADVLRRMTSLIPENNKGKQVIGYTAYFELHNGFTGHYSMTVDQMAEHANKFSQSYRYAEENKKGAANPKSVWHDNFEAMALKTVIKLMLSKKAPLSVEEFAIATKADQAVIIDGQYRYVDNDVNYQCGGDVVNQLVANINGAETLDELVSIGKSIANQPISEQQKDYLRQVYANRKSAINKATRQAYDEVESMQFIDAEFTEVVKYPVSDEAKLEQAKLLESELTKAINVMTLEDANGVKFFLEQNQEKLAEITYTVLESTFNNKFAELEAAQA